MRGREISNSSPQTRQLHNNRVALSLIALGGNGGKHDCGRAS